MYLNLILVISVFFLLDITKLFTFRISNGVFIISRTGDVPDPLQK